MSSGHRVSRGPRGPQAAKGADTWQGALLAFIAGAGLAGVTSLAIRAWCQRTGKPYKTCHAYLARQLAAGTLVSERSQAGRPDIGRRNCSIVLYRRKA